MNKSILKFIVIVIVSVIFMYAFSASYTSKNIDNIAYVTAMGIDLSEDGENLQVTFEFIDTSSFSSNQSSETTTPIIDSITSTSIYNCINLLNSYIGKEVNLSHCKVIIFSKDVASRGIFPEITELMNNIQIRPTANLVISKIKATEYIKNSTSSLEKVLTKYYDIFPNSTEYTGYLSNVMIGQFYNCLMNKTCGNLAILGGENKSTHPPIQNSSNGESSNGSGSGSSSDNSSSSNSSSEDSSEENKDSEKNENQKNVSPNSIVAGNSPIIGERGIENIGLAVLKDDKYIGELTATNSLCHTLIDGEVNSFLLTINEPELYEHYLDINLIQNYPSKISVNTNNDSPIIDINIELTGRIAGIKKDVNYYSKLNLDLDKISETVNIYLKNQILDFLNKTVSEYKCDINKFHKYAKSNFLTNKDWENYDWANKYLQSTFNVSVNTKINYSLLNSD